MKNKKKLSEEEEFTSGNRWLNIRLAQRLFVIEYRPGAGFGISLVGPNRKSPWDCPDALDSGDLGNREG